MSKDHWLLVAVGVGVIFCALVDGLLFSVDKGHGPILLLCLV